MARIRRMSEVYSSGDVSVTIAGLVDINPSSIEYNVSYDHTYQRGLKRKPRGWRMGAQNMDAKITLPLDVVAELERIAPDGDIAKLRPFPINIVFPNTENELIMDYVYAKFTGNGRSVTADGELEREMELFPLDIKMNVTNI
ncbi:MAG: hypothetical protein ACK5L5_04130 [Bacteroidales bacterium]